MPVRSEGTGSLDDLLVLRGDTAAAPSDTTLTIDRFLRESAHARQSAQMIYFLSRCSDATGGFVQLNPEYQYVPILMGDDGVPIPLYHCVEVLDEFVEYDQVKKELPTLSYSQINGAISFLRKVVQYNPSNIDFDLIEDQKISTDPIYLNELRRALADEET